MAGVSFCSVNILPQTAQWEPCVSPGSVQVASFPASVTTVCPSAGTGSEGVITAPDEETDVQYYYQSGSVTFEPREEDQVISAEEFREKWEGYHNACVFPELTPVV